MPKPGTFTIEAKRKYLNGIRKHGTVGAGCEAAKVSRETVRLHRDSDEAFAQAERDAHIDHDELIVEKEIKRRAIDGILEPVHYQGERVDKIRKFSDVLLQMYAKRRMTAYRDRHTVDHNLAGGVLVLGGGDQDAEGWAATDKAGEKGRKPE